MKIWRLLGFVPLAALLSGCATSALWKEDRFARIHEPATPPNLILFESVGDHDLLVLYDEWLDVDTTARKTRAYWLRRNREPVSNPHQPDFVSPYRAKGLRPLPIYNELPERLPSGTNLFAVTVINPPGFVLYSGSSQLGSYELPFYEDAHGRTMQVLLTPGAVTVDAIMVGTCLGLIYWAYGAPFDVQGW